ncbi:MAG TPA: branched-chain-amino-acid transaminase [Nitrososphaerales archaeon]|nr:branched-chain-amino-acid transaminase [Nitrososphaerales archaeon]
MLEPLVYVNGEFVEKSKATVSVFDHGVLYGDGVFEGIRAYNGIVFKLDQHVERLFNSAKVLQLVIPLSRHEMAEAIMETVRKNQLRDAYIRVVVTRGTGDLGVDPSSCKTPTLFIIAEPSQSSLGSGVPRLVSLVTATVRRDAVDGTSHEVKSLNYLNSILAKMEARRAGVDDALMLDHRGFVSESSASNIFIVKDNKVSTPATSAGILHGITRARIIRLCSDLGLEVSERDITPFELLTADEAFLVGTKAEILAVGTVNGTKIGTGTVGPVVRRVASEFAKVVARREEGTPAYESEYIDL